VLPSHSRTGGHLRRILTFVALATVLLGAYGFVRIGPYLTREDPLQKADAIFVLAGTRMLRPLEAADLYLEGYAPRIVMTRELEEARAFAAIRGRGHEFLMDVDRARELFQTLGVPSEAIVIPDRLHDSTAAEAVTLRELAETNGWRRIIVVTSRFHVARARFAVRRELRGGGPQIIMHASRYDPLQPERWWTRRGEVRWVASELPKLVAYVFGLGA
jgi:uncharacterized SAM-binding protein YcdF (DUF218 family)